MPKICQNSSFMIFLHSIFLHLIFYHCNLKITLFNMQCSVDWAPQGSGSSLVLFTAIFSLNISSEQIIAVLMRENAHGSLGPVMMLCSKRHRQGIALFFSLVTPFTDSFLSDWPLGTHRGHVGCRHGAALPCAPSHENVENMEIRWFRNQFSEAVFVYQNGMEQVGEQLIRFQRESRAVVKDHHWGKSSCENPQPPGLRQWNVQVLF